MKKLLLIGALLVGCLTQAEEIKVTVVVDLEQVKHAAIHLNEARAVKKLKLLTNEEVVQELIRRNLASSFQNCQTCQRKVWEDYRAGKLK